MDTLDRYLLREYLMYFVVILLGLAVLFVGIDFLTGFLTSHLPLAQTFEVYGCKLPAAFQQFFPVSCLLALLLIFSNMSRQNEILALYVSGVGALRLVSTIVAIVATLSTVAFLTFDSTVPFFNKRKTMILQGLDPNKEELLPPTQNGIWYRSNHLIYNVGRFLPERNEIEDVSVFVLDGNLQILEKMRAKHATYADHAWHLKDGFSVSYPAEDPFPITHTFAERVAPIQERPSDFKTLKLNEEVMRLRDLRKYILTTSSSGLDTTVTRVIYHERLAYVFTPLVFILTALPFTLKPMKNHAAFKSVGYCFTIVFAYLVLSRLTLSIGRGGHLSPFISAWLPNVIFLLLALFNFHRSRKLT